MKRTHANLRRELRELHRFTVVRRIKQLTNTLDQRELRIGNVTALRFTTQTRAETCFLRCFSFFEKRNAFATRPPRWTRWPAVNFRRAHREDKLAVKSCVFRQHRA